MRCYGGVILPRDVLISGSVITIDETQMLTFLETINLVAWDVFKQARVGPPLCPSNFLVRKLDHRLHNSLFITVLLKGNRGGGVVFFPLFGACVFEGGSERWSRCKKINK